MTLTLDEKLDNSFVELGISDNQRSSIMVYLDLIRNKSLDTWNHSVRVGLTGKKIAKYTHIINPKALFYLGLLHDVGKTLTDSESLNKSEDFGKRDIKELSRHPIDSYRILKGIHDFSARVALLHHYFQGDRSYPKTFPKEILGLSNQTNTLISYCARLISLVDFHDAATYRKNDFNGQDLRLPSNEEVKTTLIKFNPDQKYLVKNLYTNGIFGKA